MYDKKLFIYANNFNVDTKHLAILRPGIINDIDGGPKLWYNTIYYYDDNTIFFWVDASELITRLQSEEF